MRLPISPPARRPAAKRRGGPRRTPLPQPGNGAILSARRHGPGRRMDNARGDRRPLRKLSGRVVAVPAAAASGRHGDLPLRTHRRRPGRRRRCNARPRGWRSWRCTAPTWLRSLPGSRPASSGQRCSRRCARPCVEHALPVSLLHALLDAFEQDVRNPCYRRPRRTARLLRAVGQPGRPAAAAPVPASMTARRWRSPTRSAARCS